MARTGRPEQPIDASNEALRRLAGELRRLRGPRTYRELADGTKLSIATLRAAAVGKNVPSWKVTRTITAACEGDQAQVRKLWEDAYAAAGRAVPDEHMPAGPPVPVRGEVTSTAQLVDMMRRLRGWAGSPSLATLNDRAAGHNLLPPSTVSDMLRSRRLPRLELVSAFVRACGLDDEQVAGWEAAWAELKDQSSAEENEEVTARSNSFPGRVYMTPDKNMGIFLDPENRDVLKNAIDQMISEPAIAGPPLDMAMLGELREVVGESRIPVSEDGPPVVLSRELSIYIELILGQFFVRLTVPLKIRLTCQECGAERIADPARIAKRQQEAEQNRRTPAIMDSVAGMNMAVEHPWFAILRSYGAISRTHPSNEFTCRNCDGEHLDLEYVSFCPKCHTPRAEAVLLQCPDCGYDFRTYSHDQVWSTSTEALREFKASYKKAVISEKVTTLYGRPMPGQARNLASGISPDETLLGICRCSIVGNRRKDTIILFTSEKIAWSIQGFWASTGIVSPERHSVTWSQVQDISGPAHGTAGVWLKLTDGATIFLGGFIGTGASMSPDNLSFGPEGVQHAINQIWRASRGTA